MESHLVLALIIVTVFAFPLTLGKIPRNRFYGFRLAKTLENDEIWYRANKVAGRSMLVAALVGIGIVRLAQAEMLPLAGDALTLAALTPLMLAIACLLIWVGRQP